ncbi:MAG TPA: response regulator [Kofleriaceae bacterium]|nr:response regulator [Kofleriaceae bacterium]
MLIVDDYPDTAAMASDLLGAQGHECRVATCGADALRIAEAFMPELAILDIGLPDIDGCELATALRNRLVEQPPYLVAMSGWNDAVDRARDAGFDHCLLKPVDRQQFLHALELARRPRMPPRVYGNDQPSMNRCVSKADD